MNIEEIVKKQHQNMVDKGFYICPECESNEKLEGYPDPDCKTCHGSGINHNKNICELLMLIVSELSEALEAHRTNRFARWEDWENGYSHQKNLEQRNTGFELHIKDTFEDEIADVFLRLFDLCGYLEISDNQIGYIKAQFHPSEIWEKDSNNIGTELFCIDSTIHYFYREYQNGEEHNNGLTLLFRKLWNFCNFHNIPIEKHILTKMAYNKTRPHKHGKNY